MGKGGKGKGGQQSGTKGRLQRWFSHRRLVAVEALLLAALLESVLEDWVVAQPDLAGWIKVLFSMILVVGLFGGVMLVLEGAAKRSIDRTTGMVKALPVPTPVLAIHSAFLIAIFFAYAWQMQIAIW